MTQPPLRTLATFTLVVAILATITDLFDIYLVLTIVILGFSIYLLRKVPKELKAKRGALLLIIATALHLVTAMLVLGTLGVTALNVGEMAEKLTESQAISMMGGIIVSLLLAFVSWVLRIVGTVFAYMDYIKLKTLADTSDVSNGGDQGYN